MNNFRHNAIAMAMHKKTNIVLAGLILAAAFSYIYFANTAVRTLTDLEKTREEILSLRVEVSEMESKRLSIENDVSTGEALRMGFVEVKNPTFVMKSSRKPALSYKTD